MNKKVLFYSLTGVMLVLAGIVFVKQINQPKNKPIIEAPPVVSSKTISQKDVYDDIPAGELDFAYDFTNQKVLADHADNIILATIKDVNYTNFDYRSNRFTDLIMTTGKLEIKHVFKGNYAKGDAIDYERTGGYVPVAQYEKGEAPESLAKRKALRQKSGTPELSAEEKTKKLVRKYNTKNDIEIEAGKTYLLYTINDTNKLKTYRFTKDSNPVEIIGFEYGAREANAADFSESIKFKNNQTKFFEEFSFK